MSCCVVHLKDAAGLRFVCVIGVLGERESACVCVCVRLYLSHTVPVG